MLSRRLTSKMKVISINDPSSLQINDRLMSRYVQTRDFSLIEKEIEKLVEKPTIFQLIPLKSDMEYLADNILTNSSGTAWSIFKHHVKGAENFNAENGEPLLVFDDNGVIEDDCRDNVAHDVYQEIAGVIMHKANEPTRPFTMPATWLRTRIQSRALLATNAESEHASAKPTE